MLNGKVDFWVSQILFHFFFFIPYNILSHFLKYAMSKLVVVWKDVEYFYRKCSISYFAFKLYTRYFLAIFVENAFLFQKKWLISICILVASFSICQ